MEIKMVVQNKKQFENVENLLASLKENFIKQFSVIEASSFSTDTFTLRAECVPTNGAKLPLVMVNKGVNKIQMDAEALRAEIAVEINGKVVYLFMVFGNSNKQPKIEFEDIIKTK